MYVFIHIYIYIYIYTKPRATLTIAGALSAKIGDVRTRARDYAQSPY